MKTLKSINDYETIFQIFDFYLKFSIICKCDSVQDRLAENIFDQLKDLVLPNHFQKFINGLPDICAGINCTSEFEQSLVITSCHFEIKTIATDHDYEILSDDKLELLMNENYLSKVKKLGAHYVLCYMIYRYHYQTSVELQNSEKTVDIVVKLHKFLELLIEYLKTAMEVNSNNRVKLFEETKVLQTVCATLTFLLKLRSLTNHLPSETFLAHFKSLAKYIEYAVFNHGITDAIKQWTSLVKNTVDYFPKNNISANLLRRWIQEQKFEVEFQALLFELIKKFDSFKYTIATTILKLKRDNRTLKVFLKKLVAILQEARNEENVVTKDIANIVNEIIDLIKQELNESVDENESKNEYSSMSAIEELVKVILKDNQAVEKV